MSIAILRVIQVGTSIYEVWLCYQLLYCTVLEKKYLRNREKILIWGNILILGGMLAFNRSVLFFSHSMFLLGMIVTIISALIIYRKNVALLFGIIGAYYALLSLMDLFFSLLSMGYLKGAYEQSVNYNASSLWQGIIFMCSRVIMTGCICLVYKNRLFMKQNIEKYKNILIMLSAIFCVMLRYYQTVIYKMLNGLQKMQGISEGVTLIAALLIIVYIGNVLMKSKMIQEENNFLIMREKLLEKNYENIEKMLEKNRCIMHDAKNQVVLLSEYERERNWEKIHLYLEEIKNEFQDISPKVWTGCNILDMILNQKKVASEQGGITFSIHTDSIQSLPMSDREICSLFGNLLDNAFEACERVKSGEKWINILIEKQNNLLFISIANSMEAVPIKKDGVFITTKSDKAIHGYGLKSVKNIVETYGGVIDYQVLQDKFQVDVSFFDIRSDS